MVSISKQKCRDIFSDVNVTKTHPHTTRKRKKECLGVPPSTLNHSSTCYCQPEANTYMHWLCQEEGRHQQALVALKGSKPPNAPVVSTGSEQPHLLHSLVLFLWWQYAPKPARGFGVQCSSPRQNKDSQSLSLKHLDCDRARKKDPKLIPHQREESCECVMERICFCLVGFVACAAKGHT